MAIKKKVCTAFIFAILFFCNVLKAQNSGAEIRVFRVSKATKTITIDGKSSEPDWQRTEVRSLDHFVNVEKPTDQQETEFRVLWDDENLYVHFDCKDQFITVREKERDGQPYFDDCAEIFLIPVPEGIDMHFGFELNLYKASNDFIYLNSIYKDQDAVVKSFDPDFEVEVSVDGTINDNSDLDNGWTIEMAIPLKLFKAGDKFTDVEAGAKWTFLAVRQDRNDADGNRRSTSTIFPLHGDGVHEPGRFGTLEFVD